ncbi:MAG TPA: LON peptidase substrate-binding domain-containing protein [Thermoanaerobaculia bacterium]|nr:LON peptidase substrate-binding domain-containing protein [Thermoanaerobaculia bacterium]
MDPDQALDIPLFPVADAVCFPGTELSLEVAEESQRRLIAELGGGATSGWLGVVLVKPGWGGGAGSPPVFPAGTACQVVRVETSDDGRLRLVVRGSHRFLIEKERHDGICLRARVRLVAETGLDEGESGVRALRQALCERLLAAREAMGDSFPLSASEVDAALDAPIEELVNRVAGRFDMPPLRKLELLTYPLPDRALELLGILRSRTKLLQLLRPYRRLAANSEWN